MEPEDDITPSGPPRKRSKLHVRKADVKTGKGETSEVRDSERKALEEARSEAAAMIALFKSERKARRKREQPMHLPRGITSQITLKELDAQLTEGAWLKSEVINLFGDLVASRHVNIQFINSYFIRNDIDEIAVLHEERGRAFTVGLHQSTRLLFLPVNHKNRHWSLFVYDVAANHIHHLDSKIELVNRSRVESLSLLIKAELIKEELFNHSTMNDVVDSDRVPQQVNGDDCGIYVCYFMEALAKSLTLDGNVPISQILRELPSMPFGYRSALRTTIVEWSKSE